MAKPTRERTAPGTARVAFIAHLDTIKAELEQGYTAQAIYKRHEAKLAGSISYPQFTRYARQLREDGVAPPVGRAARPASRALPVALPAPPPPEKGSSDARHEPAAPRTFTYDGNPSAADDELIFGRPKPKG